MSRQRHNVKYELIDEESEHHSETSEDEDHDEPMKVLKEGKKKSGLYRTPVAQFLPEQFALKERPIPWKAIGYAALLFVSGTILLLCGCLIHTGHVDSNVSPKSRSHKHTVAFL